MKASIWIEDGRVNIRSDYCKRFVEEIKQEIPHKYRTWNDDKKLWIVDPSYLDALNEIAERYYEVNCVSTNTLTPEESPYDVMLRLADNMTLKKIYAVLAVALHPDTGGNTEKMQKLNEAWNAIKQERGL